MIKNSVISFTGVFVSSSNVIKILTCVYTYFLSLNLKNLKDTEIIERNVRDVKCGQMCKSRGPNCHVVAKSQFMAQSTKERSNFFGLPQV